MKIYVENSLKEFDFWSGAKETAKYLTDSDFDTIEAILEDCQPDGMSETAINDLFWFDDDLIAEWLGYADFETLMEERSED